MITIELYKHFDLDSVLPLYDSAGWYSYTSHPDMLKRSFDGSLAVLAAADGDRLVGVIRAVGDGASILFIEDLLVAPEYRRRGIGSALLQKMVSLYPGVYQTVPLTDDQPALIECYRSLGFAAAPELGCTSFIKINRNPG